MIQQNILLAQRFLLIALIAIVSSSCQKDLDKSSIESVIVLRDSLKLQYVPDGRVARFDIEVKSERGKLVLTGETDQTYALATFMNNLPKVPLEIQEDINLLPDASIERYSYAVVNNSVANLRSKPKHSAELATQATLGTVLKMLKKTDEWYLVQSPDDYIAWVDHGGVDLKTKFEIENWRNAEKVIVTETAAVVYKSVNQTTIISDVILGNVLEKLIVVDGMVGVGFPDGRVGYVAQNTVKDYKKWLGELNSSGFLVEYYARKLMGAPYLWGGTSAKGMDCSGFTKTVYLMNGLVIPRDASQQIDAGKEVDESLTFSNLKKGDLLFFGKPATDSTKQRTTHVGIWLGAGEFIHASKRVRISSIDPSSINYDEFNKNRYLGSRRYLRNIEGNITDLRAQLIQK